ncbi:aldehyde dehydrogenase [Hoeflea ulvae]|uniref:Aldehyde dehydrogenase n=1 Tax=Hoeflea ulvae TaxID=2983764 RepID=A0ABT3YLH1_9HYPH|nr:aldehyde dehydrogenase [Hoeflea ulvae]MCY0096744.1 aldehyde dehydrogenase [Hoeflea ulvae]
MSDARLFIGGKYIDLDAGKTSTRLDPVTGEVATRFAAATTADAKSAVNAAAEAFEAWSSSTPAHRRAVLSKAADLLSERAGDFIAAMQTEIGSTAGWAGFNVMLASQILREAAAMTTQVKGEIIPSNKPGSLAMAVRKPAGVCLGMAPWNAPVILGVRALAMPLAVGNTVVLKSSENCPMTHLLIAECLHEAGCGDGVVNVISNAPEDAAELVRTMIAHPSVRRINFTGSTSVGREIAKVAAEYLKPVLLELGGKAPLVVLEDADIDGAVNAAVFGCFMNQGQICMSTERVLVASAIADEFTEKFAARASALVAADPRENGPLGSLVGMASTSRLNALVKDAVAKGATVLTGGESDSVIYQPTILTGVTEEMRLFREESFGPVKAVYRFDTEEEALRMANDTEYGLSAAVFSQDVRRAQAFADRIESGICHINGPTVHDEAQMPFGGVKNSGYGRFGGTAAIYEFTDLRWVTIEDPNQHYPI